MATSNVTQTSTTSTIPDWAQSYFTGEKGIFPQAQALAQKGYETYGGDRQAGLSGLTQTAIEGAANMTPSTLTNLGGGIAGSAALNAGNVNYQGFQPGQFTGEAVSQYMNPFMQNVVDIQQREAQRRADIAGTGRNAQAVKAGAFGGSRQGIMDAEAARNLAIQQGDIQAQGLNQAFTQAQGQFNTEQQLAEQARQYGAGLGLQGLQTAIQGAGQLGTLGQQGFTQDMDINKLQAQYGSQQQAMEQAKLDQQYQDFLTQQQYPYQQLGFYTDILGSGLRGASGVTSQASNMYAPPPSTTSQLLGLGTAALGAYGAFGKAEGGTVGYAGGGAVGYASGGISGLNPMELDAATDKMSDQQMQGVMGLASVTDLAKMQIAQKLAQNNQIRQAAQQAQAQAQAGQQPQTSIAEEAMMQMGVGGLDVPEDTFNAAGGGIVAFAGGGTPYERRSARRLSASQEDSETNLANQDLLRKEEERARVAARDVTKPLASPTSAAPTASDYAGLNSLIGKYANLGDEPMKAAKEATQTAGDAEIKANEEFVAQMRRDQEAMGERGVEEMKSIKASQKDMEGAKDKNLNMSLIEAGLAMMAGTSQYAFENIGKGALVGTKAYKEGADKIQTRTDKLQEALNRLNDARFSDKKDNAKEVRAAEKDVKDAKTALGKDLANVQVEGAKVGAANARAAIDAQVKIGTEKINAANAMARTIRAIPALSAEASQLLEQGNRIAGMPAGPEKDAAEKALAERRKRLEAAARAQYPGGAAVEQRAATAGAKLSAAIEDSINKAVELQQLKVKSMPEGPARVAAQKLVDAEKEKLREQYRRAGAGGGAGGSSTLPPGFKLD